MLQNYLTAAFRNLLKRKGFSLINILGLSLGITAFFLILQYVSFEWSYDQYHENKEDIYRVQLDQYQNGELLFKSAENYPALGPALQEEFPEVLHFTRLYNLGAKNNMIVSYEENPTAPVQFKHKRLLYADETFFPMFSYQLLAGDEKTALEAPFKMAITESYAKKYFGDMPLNEVIGKMLHMQDDDFNDELCEVTAVVKDPSANSHLKFDILISYSTLYARYEGSDRARERYDRAWWRKDMYTYIQVKPGTDPNDLASKFPTIIEKYNPELAENNREDLLSLQPLTKIHLTSRLSDEVEPNGDGDAVQFLFLISLFILLIAYINYINLATARSLERANEVGIRKVLGAFRAQLIRQFLLESVLVNFVSVAIGAGIFILLLPFFSQLAGLPQGEDLWNYAIWNQTWFIGLILGLLTIGPLLSGIYPAFVLSGFKPVSVLSGKLKGSKQGVLFRKGLVVFQFAACVALIIGTFTVYHQLNFMQNQELGFNPDQMMVIERPGIQMRDFEARKTSVVGFKDDLEQHNAISDVTGSLTIPGKKMRWKSGVRKYTASGDQEQPFNFSMVDYAFTDAFGMKILAGRNFSESYGTDADTACLITESGVRALGFSTPEEAIGEVLAIPNFRWNPIIVGVVNDFHQESLRESPEPTLFSLSPYNSEYFLMRVSSAGLPATVAHIESVWNERFPNNPFQYFFLDEFFNAQYQNDQRFGRIFGLFSILAILIGCLGLFGLSAFATQQRVKEISVRKVLGASTSSIFGLLTSDFLKLVLIANVIAWPIIGWLMNNWLQDFAYRISLSWWLFVLAGVVVMGIALLTVSFQSLRAASANPADALRSE